MTVTRTFDAHLTILNIGEVPILPIYGYGGQGYADIWLKDCDQRKNELQAVSEQVEARLSQEGFSSDVRSCLASSERQDNLVARHAVYCDLAIVPRASGQEMTALEKQAIDGALFDSGRPVLYVPKDSGDRAIGKRIAIAWNAQREAARAVSDALPFLSGCEELHVFLVDPQVGDNEHGEDPGTDIALVLSRHGLKVSVQNIASAGRPVSEALRAMAGEFEIDLMVMGAYGHSRLRENILGGTTREMLENNEIPLFLSR
ncbi:universal stress protein [Roseibium sp.]